MYGNKYSDQIEAAWHGVGIASTIAAVILTIGICFAPKNVDYYYVSKGSTTDIASCVQAHWTWHTDEKAYCSNNPQEVLDFMRIANSNLPKK